MPIECQYSFEDLFAAAFGQRPTVLEADTFRMVSQEEKNKMVKEWAARAGWEAKDKQGNDGKTYTAFCPKF